MGAQSQPAPPPHTVEAHSTGSRSGLIAGVAAGAAGFAALLLAAAGGAVPTTPSNEWHCLQSFNLHWGRCDIFHCVAGRSRWRDITSAGYHVCRPSVTHSGMCAT